MIVGVEMQANELTDVRSHFRFGANWASFARLIDADRINAAVSSLRELVGSDLAGKSFLDIGCGSGLSSLAAARLGAGPIVATDIDSESTGTTAEILAANLPAGAFMVRTISVFDMNVNDLGTFDVVHSWGVLHHTGDMWRAIKHAAQFTKPDGCFVIAIYRRTPFCAFWRMEKSFYSRAPRSLQRSILALYRCAYYGSQLVVLRNPWRRAREYRINRGMDQAHDFHDWLGGYPYESATPGEIDRFLSSLGFRLEHGKGLAQRGSDLFGTGCAEYVYRRSAPPVLAD